MHPDRQLPAHCVVHMPSCLHVFFRVARPLHSNRGGKGTTWGMFPWGCKDTVACRWLLYKGGGFGMMPWCVVLVGSWQRLLRGYVRFQQILRETKSKSANFRIRWSKSAARFGAPKPSYGHFSHPAGHGRGKFSSRVFATL